jgi:hypothetical protein
MRVVQPFSKQHTKPTLRANLSTVKSEVTDEATTRTKEEVSILIGQTGQSVERETIHGHINRGREERSFIKVDPMDVVVIRHDLLNYPNTLQQPSPLYPRIGQRSITSEMKVRQRMGQKELKGQTWDQQTQGRVIWDAPGSTPTRCRQSVHFVTPSTTTSRPIR